MYKCESPWIKLPLFLSFLPFVHHFSFCWPTKLFCKKCYGRVHVSRCEIKIFFSPKSSLLFWCFFFSSILLVVHRCNKLLIVLKILVEGFFLKFSSAASAVSPSLSSLSSLFSVSLSYRLLLFLVCFHLFHVTSLSQIRSNPVLSVFFKSKEQMFYLKYCEHGQRLNRWVLLEVIKGHAILVEGKLHMSVSGNLFPGATSFLHRWSSNLLLQRSRKGICVWVLAF